MTFLIGNTNSPVRALTRDRRNQPLYVTKAQGANVFLDDGSILTDFIMGYGCLPFGHAFPPLVQQLQKGMQHGSSFGITSTKEEQAAQAIITSLQLPNTWKVRMGNSGSDATALAVRLAQTHTGKTRFIRFKECYPGWNQLFFDDTGCIAEFNNIESVKKMVKKNKSEISAIILEPICANNGLHFPANNFLQELQYLCSEENILLIFDEVITAYRLHFGGAFSYYGVQPDIITLGKTLSNGYPFGAVLGKKEIMEHCAPKGRLFHAGTFNGNSLVCDSILFTLSYLDKHYKDFKKIERCFSNTRNIVSIGSMFHIQTKNKKMHKELYFSCLENGILLSPSHHEVGFVSLAHTEQDIEKFAKIVSNTLFSKSM